MKTNGISPTNRRSFITKAAGAAMASALPYSAYSDTRSSKKRPPNVLFIMSDDMRVELGSYNSRFHAQTPNLDALARHGVRFDRNYCQFPLCNPSRASLLNGKTPHSTGVLGNRTDFRAEHPDFVSLPQFFRDHGYATPRVGKIFHGGIDDPKAWTEGEGEAGYPKGNVAETKKVIPQYPVPPRPENVLPTNRTDSSQAPHSDQILVIEGNGEGHPENLVAERAIEHLNTYKNQPFFLGCGFSKPHSPPTAPQRFFDLYNLDKIDLTPDFEAWPTVPLGFPKAAIRMRNADLFIGRGASREEAKEVIRAYIASISWVDWNVGRVLAELDRLGLRENTIVVFSVDHGYQLGEKGKWSKAGSLFEMGTRVPLIIDAPGVRGNGQSVTRIVQSLDIYPTLVELSGLNPPNHRLEGRSLVPLLNKPHVPWDHPAFSIWSEDGATVHGTAVRDERWRYAEFGEGGKNGTMLFDEHADPLEMKNLTEDPHYVHQRARLSELIRSYAAQEIA